MAAGTDTKKKKISLISGIHFFRLTYRGLLLIWAVLMWIIGPRFHSMNFAEGKAEFPVLFLVIWITFVVEMIFRFFPSPTESMGCQKQFGKNFVKTQKHVPDIGKMNHGVLLSGILWLVLNGIIGVLYFTRVFTDGVLILISLFFAVSDMICILFFCPFQTLLMKNRCCTTCRIYNWDYLMMFTPLVFIRSLYTWSLVALALGLFARWEITAFRHPERFTVETNGAMRCANCKEKLCHHKKQLISVWEKHSKILH